MEETTNGSKYKEREKEKRTCFRVPKNKDLLSKSKMIQIQPNENWIDFKPASLKYLSGTAKTQIGVPLKIYGMTAVHRCSPSKLS